MTLALHDVTFGYQDRTIVSGLSAAFLTGRVVAILGNNGIGKSTLLKGILGLIPTRAGHVMIDNKSVHSMPPAQRAQRLAYLEQQASCHWPMPVKRVIGLGRHPYGTDQIDDALLEQVMQMTDTHALAKRPVTQLSGGERTRVMLARALAVDAPILLADEPVAGLDPHHQISVMAQLRQWTLAGRTVILTLHDLNLALHYCDDVLLLGKQDFHFGDADSLLNPGILSRFFQIEAKVTEVDGQLSLVNWRQATVNKQA